MEVKQYDSDTDFVDGIRSGGAALHLATDALYRKYRQDALRFVQNFVGSRSGQQEDVKDLVQDAFVILVEKVRFGGYNEGSLLHFWIGITKGLLRNKVKRDARTDLVDDTLKFDRTEFQSPEDQLISGEKREVLNALLEKLGQRCKSVLLYWAGGYSMQEIADKLNFSSEAMARKTKYKCKNQLLELVDNVNIDL